MKTTNNSLKFRKAHAYAKASTGDYRANFSAGLKLVNSNETLLLSELTWEQYSEQAILRQIMVRKPDTEFNSIHILYTVNEFNTVKNEWIMKYGDGLVVKTLQVFDFMPFKKYIAPVPVFKLYLAVFTKNMPKYDRVKGDVCYVITNTESDKVVIYSPKQGKSFLDENGKPDKNYKPEFPETSLTVIEAAKMAKCMKRINYNGETVRGAYMEAIKNNLIP